MRNGPDVTPTASLSPNDDVIVWREGKGDNKGWTGPFKLLSIDSTTATIDMPYGPTQFRTTVVKPYYRDESVEISTILPPTTTPDDDRDDNHSEYTPEDTVKTTITTTTTTDAITSVAPTHRRRGRPKGSKNKPKIVSTASNVTNVDDSCLNNETLLTAKEEYDHQLSLTLRSEGKITTPGKPFEASDQAEITTLIKDGVFRFEQYDPTVHTGRLFNSRLVREIKNKTTNPYEKSRLVIQGFNDRGKADILTQAPTIQRASQRLILALAPSLMLRGHALWLRDITQAYLQSETML
jgi:hypothetical protein